MAERSVYEAGFKMRLRAQRGKYKVNMLNWAFAAATVCLVFSAVSAQTDLNTTSLPYFEEQNQTLTSPSSTNSSLLETDALNVTADAVTLSPTNSTPANTTAKMEMTYIARMPTTQAPTESPKTPAETPLDPPENQLMNLTMFDILVKQSGEYYGYNLSDPSQECSLRSVLEPVYFNFEMEDGGYYCPSYFDEIQCWKASPPGVAVMNCPDYFRGIWYNTNDTVTRFCHFNGTWGNGNKSNYEECSALWEEPAPDLHARAVDMITYAGYSLSFTTLLGAFFILLYFKSLRCVRNYIHLNLVASFILLYLVFFFILIISTFTDQVSNSLYCRLQATSVYYITLTNFFWMFVEGLYLHTMVVRALSVRREKFWVYCVIGWGLPVVFAITHAVTMTVMKQNSEKQCLKKNEVDYIIRVPIMAVILVNVCFMIHIVIILVTKLRASHSFETQQYKKGVRGIVVLLPLLGASYFMLLLEPSPDNPNVSTYVYRYLNAFLQSTQGFFVAVIYVYMNQEVQNVIKRRFRRWREANSLPTRHHSRRGSNSRQNSMGATSYFRKGSRDETIRTGLGRKISSDHVGNGKVPTFAKPEELLPLQPVSESSPIYNSKAPTWPVPDSPDADKDSTSLTGRNSSPGLENIAEVNDVAIEDIETNNYQNAGIEDPDTAIPIAVGSDEALIVHDTTPVVEHNLFLQDKLMRENNNVQRNGVPFTGTDGDPLPVQDITLTNNHEQLEAGQSAIGLDQEGNENNSNNTQLPCILKTVRGRPYPSAKKHVVFVCPEMRGDFQSHPQQLFDDNDLNVPYTTNVTFGVTPPAYTCSTIASDPWTREGERAKWSPKILFKRPKCYDSPNSQRVVLPTSGDQGTNGRIQLPKSPAGTPV